MSRLWARVRPANHPERLAYVGAAIGIAAVPAWAISEASGHMAGGVGLGLWLAALYLWLVEEVV